MLSLAIRKSTIVRYIVEPLSLRLWVGLTARLRPAVALAWAEQWFMSPPRYPIPAVELDWLARATTRMVRLPTQPVAEWTGQAVAVHRWGPEEGPVVLLVHGWGGCGTQLWSYIQPLRDAGFTVLAVDAPGHGQSEGHASSLPQFIAALKAAIQRPLAGVIAHSLGGAATVLAMDAGLRVERVVLIAPPVDLEAYSRRFAHFIGLPEGLRRTMQERFEHRLQLPWQALDPRPTAARSADTGALIIHDRGDREVPFEAGMSLADAWPGCRRLVTDHLGHRRILGDERVVRAGVDFVTRGCEPTLGYWDFWLG